MKKVSEQTELNTKIYQIGPRPTRDRVSLRNRTVKAPRQPWMNL